MDVPEFIRRCTACQRHTIVKKGFHPLTPITASQPMDHIVINTTLSFPTSESGMNVRLVIVCIHTRFCFLRALPDKKPASVTFVLFNMFYDFGFPRIIQSDNGTEFVNQLMKLMTKETNIDHRLITKYHPQANGLAERFVQTACRAIHKLLGGEDRQWDRYVPSVQLYINSKIASIHNSAPFSIMFGRKLNPFADYQDSKVNDMFSTATEDYHRIRDRMPWFSEILFPAILEKESGNAAKATVNFAKAKRILKEPFPVGSYVMLRDPTRSSKNRAVYEGPFKS